MTSEQSNSQITQCAIESPIGWWLITAENSAITEIEHVSQKPKLEAPSSDVVEKAATQLREYFAGERGSFDLPLSPHGTEFQQRVWERLCAIPYGETWSYQDLAESLGDANAMRAVGAANGKNPIPIVIPCHRVIGKDGSLTGYAGGLEVKRYLLELEGVLEKSLQI